MSPCPKCGTKSRHVAITIPWDDLGHLQVLHDCPNCRLWMESAKDLPALAARAEWFLQGLDPEAAQ